jgi:hypothetical protein
MTLEMMIHEQKALNFLLWYRFLIPNQVYVMLFAMPVRWRPQYGKTRHEAEITKADADKQSSRQCSLRGKMF